VLIIVGRAPPDMPSPRHRTVFREAASVCRPSHMHLDDDEGAVAVPGDWQLSVLAIEIFMKKDKLSDWSFLYEWTCL
jgi:hypothetical protein